MRLDPPPTIALARTCVRAHSLTPHPLPLPGRATDELSIAHRHPATQAIQRRKEGLVSDILVTRQTLGSIGVPEEELSSLRMRDLLKLSTAATAYASPLSASKSTPNLGRPLRAPPGRSPTRSPSTNQEKKRAGAKERGDLKRQPWKRLADRVSTTYDDVTEYVDAGTEFAAGRYRSVDNPRLSELKAINEAGRKRRVAAAKDGGARGGTPSQRELYFD